MSKPEYLKLDAEAVRLQISVMISQYPILAEDEELLRDMVEGETSLHHVLTRIMDEKFNAEDMTTAIKAREASLKARRERFESKADAMKDLALSLMQAAKMDKVELEEATLSIRKPSKRVEIDDIDQLPQGFFSIERKADKKAIAEAFKENQPVPGSRYVDGNFGLTVKRS